MRFQLTPTAFLVAALALPIFAQDEAKPAVPAKPQGPVLVIKTAEQDMAEGMASGMELEGELPKLEKGAHYVLSVDAEGKLSAKTEQGKVGFLELSANPGALMEVFAEKVEETKGMVQGMATMMLGQQGIKAKDAAAIMKAVFDFPKQIENITLRISSNPEKAKQDGLDIDVGLTAVGGTWFGDLIAAMQPCAQGAPVLPDQTAAMQMQGSFDAAAIVKFAMPLLDIAARMVSKSPEEQKKYRAMLDQGMKIYDGGVAMTWAGPGGMKMLVGLSDPAAAQKLFGSEEYLAMMKAQSTANQMMDAEVTPKAFEHRGVQVTKTKAEMKEGAMMPPNPMMPNGVVETYIGIAGNYYIFTMFGSKEEDMKALIDAVADQKIQRAPLASGVLMQMNIDLVKFVGEMMAAMGGGAEDEDMPEKMSMSLSRTEKTLSLKIHAK